MALAGSRDAPTEARGGDLVERSLLATGRFALVLAALALPQPLEHLVLGGGGRERGLALGDLGLARAKLLGPGATLGLHAFQKRLTAEQLGGIARGGIAGKLSMLGLGALELLDRSRQIGLGGGTARDSLRKLLLGLLLATLPHRTHSLQAKSKNGSVHGPVIDRAAPRFSDNP